MAINWTRRKNNLKLHLCESLVQSESDGKNEDSQPNKPVSWWSRRICSTGKPL